MKKVLYGTTALLAAGMFTVAANAATSTSNSALKLTIGGYMNAWAGYANIDKKKNNNEGANQFDVGTDGLISFNADAKLSNNLKIGAVAELVIATPIEDQEWLKDVYGYADTKFGHVEFGATYNAAKKMHHGAPDVGVFGVSESKLVNWLGVVGEAGLLDTTTVNFDSNAKKISYFSPKFYGFQVGLTYTPGARFYYPYGTSNGAQRHNIQKPQSTEKDMYFTNGQTISLAYNNKLGAVDIGADFGFNNVKPKATWQSYDNIPYFDSDLKAKQQYSFGADIGFSGFKVGAAYTWITAGQNKSIKKNSDKAFEVGASYETGLFGVSANYFYSKSSKITYPIDTTTHVIGEKVPGSDAKFQMFQLSGRYKLGKGVDTFATFGYLKFDKKNQASDLSNVWTIVTGLALKF